MGLGVGIPENDSYLGVGSFGITAVQFERACTAHVCVLGAAHQLVSAKTSFSSGF